MQQLFFWLLSIGSSDEDVRRRGRNVVVLALSLLVMLSILVLVTFLEGQAKIAA